VTASVPCNAQSKALSPTLGTKCGRREREGRRGGRREQSLRDTCASVTVKVILAFRKAALFAGCRRNEDLGRSVPSLRVSPRNRHRTDDSGWPKGAEEGNVVSVRHNAHALDECANRISFDDASFTRSGGPCTSILTMHRGASFGGGAVSSASRLGKPTKVGGTFTGVERSDVARLAACHSLL